MRCASRMLTTSHTSLRGQRLGQTLRITFQVLAALVAGVVGCGLIVMLYDAFTSRSAVIEPFDAPAALVALGLTGKLVAAGLLWGTQPAAVGGPRSFAAKRALANAWSNEIRLLHGPTRAIGASRTRTCRIVAIGPRRRSPSAQR